MRDVRPNRARCAEQRLRMPHDHHTGTRVRSAARRHEEFLRDGAEHAPRLGTVRHVLPEDVAKGARGDGFIPQSPKHDRWRSGRDSNSQLPA